MGDRMQQNASDMQIQKQDKIDKDDHQTLITRRPTYAQWIAAAIDSTSEKAMTLADINEWMIKNVPGLAEQRYLHSCKGWKNAVRHTLSINRHRFRKIPQSGRPSLWSLYGGAPDCQTAYSRKTKRSINDSFVNKLQSTKINIEPKIEAGCEVLTFKSPKMEKSTDSAIGGDDFDDAKLLISRENKVDKGQHQKSVIDFDHVSPFSILPIQQLLIVNQKDGSVRKLLLPSPLPLTDPFAQYILGQSLSVCSSGLSLASSSSVVLFP